jgi:glycolate oxidase FAD binding subunit
MLDLGLSPTRIGMGVDLRNLNRIIDYPARDMTITVQTGITLAKLQGILAAENQQLPIDVPQADLATLGGAIATNTTGLRRYGFGTWRDYVIGISIINSEGNEFKAGGRVIKNVAGYDLCKLYTGSMGTLGIISQVTLKLKPKSEVQALAILDCPSHSLGQVLDQLHFSQTRPVCVELVNPNAARAINKKTPILLPETDNWLVVVGFEENSKAVAWQIQQLVKERFQTGIGGLNVQVSSAASPLWRTLVDFPNQPEAFFSFRANLLSSATADFCHRMADMIPEIQIQAHAGNGIVIGHLIDNITLDQASVILKEMQGWATTALGNVVVLRCPAEWKRELPIWGVPRGDAWLMREIREKLDPHHVFNPGRMG